MMLVISRPSTLTSTGETLEPSLIRAAIAEGRNYFNDNVIWQLEDVSKVKAAADTGKDDAFYASTPPGESKKALFSLYSSRRLKTLPDGTQVPLRLSFIDIKKAYFNGVPSRLI